MQNVSKLNLPTDRKLAAKELIDSHYVQLEEGLQVFNNEGSAFYLIGKNAKHSCSPNAQATFPNSNHNLHLVAIRDIQCGEFAFQDEF